MASKIQKHASRMKRVRGRIKKLIEIREEPFQLMVMCKDGYKRPAATVGPEGNIQLGNLNLSRGSARELAMWILEMHAGHVDAPPTDEKEDP